MYKIAIPSYKRPKTLLDKTLSLLEKSRFKPDIVTVFVADNNELEIYKKTLSNTYWNDVSIVVSAPGLGPSRNFIRKYYPEGTQVVNLDDDLSDILFRRDEKTLVSCGDFLKDVFQRGFDLCNKHKSNIWGIYAASNPFFMKDGESIGLYYIIGSCWGHIIRHDEDLMLTLEDKEDFQRTLQYYEKDGVVVRLDNITAKSKYYTEKGGMQETRTSERILESAEYLVNKYPDLCSLYIRKTTGHAELRLKDKRQKSEYSLENFFE